MFRDSTIIVIDTGRTIVRAGLGVRDLLEKPSVDILARVGLRRTPDTDVNQRKPTEMFKTGGISSLPQNGTATATVKDYLVGTALDEALASGQDILISWPFADGDVRDYVQAEAIWKYVLFNQLQRRRVTNESPVLLSIAPGLSRQTYEHICQIFFERFNAAGLAITERPVAQLYSTANLSGVVVDVGAELTDITPVYDGNITHNARHYTRIGIQDCESYLAHLLRSNKSVTNALFPPGSPPIDAETAHETLMQLAHQVWMEGFVRVPSDGETAVVEDDGVTDIAAILVAGKEKAVIETGMKKRATAKATAAEQARAREIEALDLVTIQFREHSLTLGKERHRFCEPLFDPSLLKSLAGIKSQDSMDKALPLQEIVGLAVSQTEIDHRQYIWQGLLVTGEITNRVKGLGTALQSRLAPFILSNPDQQTDVQPRSIRLASVPPYFGNYREDGERLAGFLGSSITAKISFSDVVGKNYVSKADYTAHGPHAIIELSPIPL